MSGAVLVAIVASIGNLLQGWDNATIAGKSRQIGSTRHAQDVSQSRWVSFLVPSDQILRHSD
jgi:hypothetical protein